MLIDCDSCAVRGPACRDCVVTVLLGAPTVRRTGHAHGTNYVQGVSHARGAVQAHDDRGAPLPLDADGHAARGPVIDGDSHGAAIDSDAQDAMVAHDGHGAVVARDGHGLGPDLGIPDTGIDLDQAEQAAIAVLASSGLVPPLRLVVRPVDPDEAGVFNWDHEPAEKGRKRRRDNGASHRDHRAAG